MFIVPGNGVGRRALVAAVEAASRILKLLISCFRTACLPGMGMEEVRGIVAGGFGAGREKRFAPAASLPAFYRNSASGAALFRLVLLDSFG